MFTSVEARLPRACELESLLGTFGARSLLSLVCLSMFLYIDAMNHELGCFADLLDPALPQSPRSFFDYGHTYACSATISLVWYCSQECGSDQCKTSVSKTLLPVRPDYSQAGAAGRPKHGVSWTTALPRVATLWRQLLNEHRSEARRTALQTAQCPCRVLHGWMLCKQHVHTRHPDASAYEKANGHAEVLRVTIFALRFRHGFVDGFADLAIPFGRWGFEPVMRPPAVLGCRLCSAKQPFDRSTHGRVAV